MNDSDPDGGGPPPNNVKVKRPGERRSLSRSATRALDVLELFGEARRPLRAIEMSKALGVHPSSMNQLLKTMVESAHLTFEAHLKTYLPSPRLARFGSWMLANYGGDGRFRSLLQNLHDASGEIVTLTTPNDLFMQVLEVIGANPSAEATERGLRVSIFGSTTGAAYLSTLPATELNRLISRARIADADVVAVLAHVACVRDAGLANGPSARGRYWSVAMPLRAELSPSPLILGLAGPAERITCNLVALEQIMRTTVDCWLHAHDGVEHLPGRNR